MAAWREEDHPRDEVGRFTAKGAGTAVQIRRTVENAESAEDEDLLTVFVRLAGKPKLSRADEQRLLVLDREMARRDAGGERQPTAQERRVDELLTAGASYEDAYREAYGGGDQDDDTDRRPGESREQMRRRQYAELTALAVLQAESACRGHLLTKQAQASGVSPVSLFSGSDVRARKHASEELRRWWQDNPRTTYAEYRAERLGDSTSRRQATDRRVQAGNGRDFG